MSAEDPESSQSQPGRLPLPPGLSPRRQGRRPSNSPGGPGKRPSRAPGGPRSRSRGPREFGRKYRWIRQVAGLLAVVVVGGGIVVGALAVGAVALLHAAGGGHPAALTAGASTRARPTANLPSGQHSSAAPSASPAARPSPSGAPSAPLPVSGIAVFDPAGAEAAKNPHPALRPDGTLQPTFASQIYATPAFGGLKQGVGLLLDLGSDHPLHSVQVGSSTPGATVQVRVAAAPQAAATGYRQLAQATTNNGTVALPVSASSQDRYLLIWVTRLGAGPSGAQIVILNLRVQ